ncbi:MAG: InlB B-repeat-containing protein, partial [Treponema sp.]|nr:InlB B-repeat-containing protein [Treponema sp.]
MKNRNILILLVVISIFSGFFGACENSNTPAGPTCTVSFEANGGTPAPKPIIVKQGGIVKAPANMTKTGFYFWGWYTESACINQWSFKGNIVTDDMTLYAKWDGNVPPAVFTVTFVANSGIPAPVTQTVTQGGKIIPPAYMTRTGYSFSGWYMDAAFTIPWNFTGDTVTGNVTLQAKWTKTDLITDINQLGPYIIQQTDGNSPDNPVNLTISIDLTPMTDSNSGWQEILTA